MNPTVCYALLRWKFQGPSFSYVFLVSIACLLPSGFSLCCISGCAFLVFSLFHSLCLKKKYETPKTCSKESKVYVFMIHFIVIQKGLNDCSHLNTNAKYSALLLAMFFHSDTVAQKYSAQRTGLCKFYFLFFFLIVTPQSSFHVRVIK